MPAEHVLRIEVGFPDWRWTRRTRAAFHIGLDHARLRRRTRLQLPLAVTAGRQADSIPTVCRGAVLELGRQAVLVVQGSLGGAAYVVVRGLVC